MRDSCDDPPNLFQFAGFRATIGEYATGEAGDFATQALHDEPVVQRHEPLKTVRAFTPGPLKSQIVWL
jgi:hypothetical protein